VAYSLVASQEEYLGQNGGTSASIDSTGATLLTLAVESYTGFPVALGNISDSKGNTWQALTARTGLSGHLRIYYAENPTVGSGHTVTVSRSDSYTGIVFSAWSGAATSGVFDVENGASNVFDVTSFQPGSVTASQANSLYITALARDSTLTTFSVDSGFTLVDTAYEYPALGYYVDTGPTAKNPTWSFSPSTIVCAVIAVFKPGAADAPSFQPQAPWRHRPPLYFR